jgi:hypothetical protein
MVIDCSNFIGSARGKDHAMTPYPIMVSLECLGARPVMYTIIG